MILPRILLLGFLLISMQGLSFAQSAKAPSGGGSEVGRYQLFQGTYTTFDLKRQETHTQQAVFLIDTKTGKVTRYVNKIDPQGKYIETWLPTDLPAEKEERPAGTP